MNVAIIGALPAPVARQMRRRSEPAVTDVRLPGTLKTKGSKHRAHTDTGMHSSAGGLL